MPRGRPKNVPQKVYDEIVGATSSAGPAENPAPGMPSAGTTKRVITERDVASVDALLQPQSKPHKECEWTVAPVQADPKIAYVEAIPQPFNGLVYSDIIAAFCANPNIMPQSGVLKSEYYRLAKDIARRIHEEQMKP